MRPEEFDKRMQQKLDEINPVFNEQDWIRLSRKMKDKKSPILFYKRITMILLLLLFVLFSTWMSLNWNTILPGSKIDNKDRMLQQPVIMAESCLPKFNTDATFESIIQDSIDSNVQGELYSMDYSNQSIDKLSSMPALNRLKSSINKNNIVISDQNNNNSNIKDNGKANLLESSDIKNTVPSKLTYLNKDQSDQLAENTGLNKISNQLQNSAVINEQQIQSSENANRLLSIVEPIELLIPSSVTSIPHPSLSAHLKPLAGLKPNKWIVGSTGLYSSSHMNTGLAFEIKTNENISFTSGLVLQNYFKQNYIDQKAFTETTAADFTDLIRPRNSNSVSYKNIQIKSSDVILPLTLKYYYPLNLKYSLFASAGLQLTLYSNTTVNFDYLPYDTSIFMKESDLNQASNSATLINNFVMTAGIQRDFGKFVIQTSFVMQKNNNNQPQITKLDRAGQLGIFYKL